MGRLADWAQHRSAIRFNTETPSPDAVEITADQALDPAVLEELLSGKGAVQGPALATPQVAAAAAQAGVQVIYTRPRLPALLAILNAKA